MDRRDAMRRVSAISHDANKNPKTKFGPHCKNLASIVRGYKSAVTIWARKNQVKFGWQERFHDHIIRSMDDYDRISEYIHYNPANWEKDPLNVV